MNSNKKWFISWSLIPPNNPNLNLIRILHVWPFFLTSDLVPSLIIWYITNLRSYRWVETWQRKKRQFLCPDGDRRGCEYGAEDDMRDARCENKSNKTLIEVLKNDLECGWSSASSLAHHWTMLIPAFILTTLFKY